MPRRYALVPVLAVSLAAAVCCGGGAADRPGAPRRFRVPPKPSDCQTVPAGRSLQASVDRAGPDAVLCLAPGRHDGPVKIRRRVTLWGPRAAVVRSRGTGTTIDVRAPGTRLVGFTVDGSGRRHDLRDSAVAVHADDVRVEGLHVVRAVFGILADQVHRLVARGNEIDGNPRQARGMRGDGIRLWETRESTIADNVVRNSRDVVVWYSPGNRIVRNHVEHGRYGTHFMYSHDNVVERNEYLGNAVGVFIMYSHGIAVRRNRFLDSHGAGGMGVGLKDSGNIVLTGNQFVRDATGLYVDTSPSTPGDVDRIERNRFQLCDTAIVFHGEARGNEIHDNLLSSNRLQVAVEGGGDARDAAWSGNHFDDYVGYDLDGDGTGDVPYELRRLSTHLSSGVPTLAFFTGTPAFGVVDALGKVVPLFAPRTLLVDPRPAIDDPTRERRRED